jgi:hypothetical protein
MTRLSGGRDPLQRVGEKAAGQKPLPRVARSYTRPVGLGRTYPHEVSCISQWPPRHCSKQATRRLPHVVDVQGLTQVDPASPSNAAGDLFSSYVLERSIPCVMARCMVNRKQVFLASCGELGDADRCADVYHDLHEVLAASETDSSLYSLLAVSPSQASHMEKAFERALWDQLNGIHQVDRNLFFLGFLRVTRSRRPEALIQRGWNRLVCCWLASGRVPQFPAVCCPYFDFQPTRSVFRAEITMPLRSNSRSRSRRPASGIFESDAQRPWCCA